MSAFILYPDKRINCAILVFNYRTLITALSVPRSKFVNEAKTGRAGR